MRLSKLLKLGGRSTWKTPASKITLIIFVIAVMTYIFSGVNLLSDFSIMSLFSGSISGMTFTLTLLTAIVSILDNGDMEKLYVYTEKNKDDKNNKDRYVFYNTFAPYAWISLLFCISSLLSLIGGVFNFQVFKLLKLYWVIVIFKYVDVALTALAIWSLFDLVIDTIISRMNKIKRNKKKKISSQ
ncbi:MAG: hypothetical protein LKI22_12070 [Liquorilactobacillus nagelii]|jgi:hypothetical protein|uniref:hypothetical protein n=1 Tax=Liquorilactobacillus nagelii TaxID=82688 RepID=UPI002432F80D|nr:hypothetical protein [Liquorilactobacillus nagelii]MCI1634555.1 hypothetical protein [Liquorilactobacillus nagelii]